MSRSATTGTFRIYSQRDRGHSAFSVTPAIVRTSVMENAECPPESGVGTASSRDNDSQSSSTGSLMMASPLSSTPGSPRCAGVSTGAPTWIGIAVTLASEPSSVSIAADTFR